MERIPPTERALGQLLERELRERLPSTWSVRRLERGRARDTMIEVVAPDGRVGTLAVEARTLLDPRDVPAVAHELRGGRPRRQGSAGVVLARYLSPRAREALARSDLSYMDATGNLSVHLDDPALALQSSGMDRDPWRAPERPTNSLRGLPAARVVRTLVERRPPWRVRELADVSAASLGSTARTVDFLERETLLQRDEQKRIVEVDWTGLLERWAADYAIDRRRRTAWRFAPRGAASVEPIAASLNSSYAISGSLAARRVAPYAEPRLALLYVEDLSDASAALDLAEAPDANNVLLVEPRDDLPFVRTSVIDDGRYAALGQVAVDLLVGPGRMPAEGQALIQWMRDNEKEWRGS
jgi:hypothetical protein